MMIGWERRNATLQDLFSPMTYHFSASLQCCQPFNRLAGLYNWFVNKYSRVFKSHVRVSRDIVSGSFNTRQQSCKLWVLTELNVKLSPWRDLRIRWLHYSFAEPSKPLQRHKARPEEVTREQDQCVRPVYKGTSRHNQAKTIKCPIMARTFSRVNQHTMVNGLYLVLLTTKKHFKAQVLFIYKKKFLCHSYLGSSVQGHYGMLSRESNRQPSGKWSTLSISSETGEPAQTFHKNKIIFSGFCSAILLLLLL